MEKKSKTNIYLDPNDMLKVYEKCVQTNNCSYELLKMFELIANKFSKSKFINFTSNHDRRACVNYAVQEAWKKWDKYDKNRSTNIFAFFTQMIKNDLLQHHEKLNKKSRNMVHLDAIFTGNMER